MVRLKNILGNDYNNQYVKMFIKFLYANGIYSKFMYNIISCKKYRQLNKNILGPSGFIISSFAWYVTPEGSDFWGTINTKWISHLAKYETVNHENPNLV